MKHVSTHMTEPIAPAVLALADGTIFSGVSLGAPGNTVGEVVFNTAMTGYQEVLTDPSYRNQIVALTYPHIGNTGTNLEDVESAKLHLAGFIIRNLPLSASNFRMNKTLPQYLQENGIVSIAQIDTRFLTLHLRDTGAQGGAIVTGPPTMRSDWDAQMQALKDQALALAQGFPGLSGLDLAQVVTCTQPYSWTEGEWALGKGYSQHPTGRFHVVAYDFGIKSNILRMLTERGCQVTVVPAKTTAANVLAMNPDGVFFSNGPGDPGPCDYAIAAAAQLMDAGLPTFGICLGHQIMALASGAQTLKMKFGHHGANHPVQELDTKQVFISSQNHGFAVDAATLPANCRATHISLFDQSLQGFMRTDKPAFCFQGHPEASPGPLEVGYLFDRFVSLMESHNHA